MSRDRRARALRGRELKLLAHPFSGSEAFTRPPPEVLFHYGNDADEFYRHDGRLTLETVREYTPKVPQKWNPDAPGPLKETQNPVNLLGPCFAGNIPVVTGNGFNSFVAAFDKRSNSQPSEDQDIPAHLLHDAILLIKNAPINFGKFDEDESLRLTWMSKFDDTKRKRMESAMLALADIGLDDPYLAEKTLSVKIEVLLKRNDPKWAPRLIYSSTDEFNALTGPLVNEVTSRLNKLLLQAGLGPITYKMGYKRRDEELASWLDDDEFPHVVEGDYSSNDLLQLKSVAYIFDALLEKVGAPQWLRTLFLSHIQFGVKSHAHGLAAWLANQLPTGTTITTCRNTVYNAVMFALYCVRISTRGKALVLGDDLLAAVLHKIDCSDWAQFIQLFGMKLKGFNVKLAGQATFLSRRICLHGPLPCMLPKIGKALARFNARANNNAAVSDSAYMAGKALSYAYEFRHFPDLRDLFLERFDNETDSAFIDVNEVSWFTRNSGIEVSELRALAMAEPLVCSYDALLEFVMDAYGTMASTGDIMDAARTIILGKTPDLIDHPIWLELDF